MDLDAVAAAYRAMVAALPGVTLHYAMKCNPFRPVLTQLSSLGCRFEVASTTELDELLAIGVDAGEVLYSNPVKPLNHIVRAYAAGVDETPVTYLGLAQCFHLFDEPGDGAEVFSLMRDSELEPDDYVDSFFDTGAEHRSDVDDLDDDEEDFDDEDDDFVLVDD